MPARIENRRTTDSEAIRQRILGEFSQRAARSGIRAVVMAELASELRMSATTLYNHFPSKGDLVTALVRRWALELAGTEVAVHESLSSNGAIEGLTHWAEAWSGSVSRYAPAFWDDLRRDHPEAWTIFRREIERWKQEGAALLRPHLREDLHPEMALEILDRILVMASDPQRCERLGISRTEAIRTGIRIWAHGALRNPGKLSELSGRASLGPRPRRRAKPTR